MADLARFRRPDGASEFPLDRPTNGWSVTGALALFPVLAVLVAIYVDGDDRLVAVPIAIGLTIVSVLALRVFWTRRIIVEHDRMLRYNGFKFVDSDKLRLGDVVLVYVPGNFGRGIRVSGVRFAKPRAMFLLHTGTGGARWIAKLAHHGARNWAPDEYARIAPRHGDLAGCMIPISDFEPATAAALSELIVQRSGAPLIRHDDRGGC